MIKLANLDKLNFKIHILQVTLSKSLPGCPAEKCLYLHELPNLRVELYFVSGEAPPLSSANIEWKMGGGGGT